jgi:outer membrane protein assembly factor BamA
VGLAAMSGCRTTKRLNDGEYLLRKNRIEFESNTHADKDALMETIRQEPNKRILGFFPFYLLAYNVPDPAKAPEKNAKRLKKLEKKNQKRSAKGKELKTLKPWGSWWQETVGEPPVVLDTAANTRSENQLRTYLIKHGWFNAEVRSEVVESGRKKRDVVYYINPKTPYMIDSIGFSIPDAQLERRVTESRSQRSHVKTGHQFNIDMLDSERAELNNYFRNKGYYNFNKELIYFDVDSTLGKHAVHLTLGIVPRTVPYPGDPDSLMVVPYRRYTFEKITIIDRPYVRNAPVLRADTLILGDYTVIDRNELKVKPKILAQNVLFKPNDYYMIDNVTRTYQRMSAFPIVQNTSIQFEPVSDDPYNTRLNCVISLTPAPKQNVSVEGKGTNRGGFLGIFGSLNYRNRNIFGGAELLEMNISAGVEAQRLLTDGLSGGDNPTTLGDNVSFNTLEFGPEIALTIPKFLLPIRSERFAKSADPRTTFRANLSYQKRPDYERTRSFASMSYKWSESDQKQWVVSPLELSLIKIFKSELFEQQLQQIGDPFLINSFQDHFIQAIRVAYTFNTQKPGSRGRNFYFYHADVESAGTLLRGLFNLANAPQDENGGYEILDITFAQYIKVTQDFRYFRHHNEKMSTAYRLSGGIGVPLTNLNALPFEKGFFGGGANNIRAWQARTLGPGSFRDPERNFDKIGDIQIQANVEYRFDLVDVLEGAFFIDAGNIWSIRSDPARPGASFEANRFLGEIALGAGGGIRLNFDFFLVRLDIGLQVKDPSLDPGERWLFQGKDQFNQYINNLNENRPPDSQLSQYKWRWNLNLGIGYPF